MYWSSTLIWLKRTIQGILDTHVHFWHGLGLTCKCGPSGPLIWVWHIILNQSIAIGKPLGNCKHFIQKEIKAKNHGTFSQQTTMHIARTVRKVVSSLAFGLWLANLSHVFTKSLFWAISLVLKYENCFLCFWAYISKLDKLETLLTAFPNPFSPYFDQQVISHKIADQENSVTD